MFRTDYQVTKSALPIVVKAIGRRNRVNVAVTGNKACTDGKTLVVPAVNPEDPDAALLTIGYAWHEIAHLRNCDFDLLDPKGDWTDFKKGVVNTFLDICDERVMGNKYPGARTDLRALMRRMVADGDYAVAEQDSHPAAKADRYMLHRMRHEILGQEAFKDLAEASERVFRAAVSPGLAAKIGAIISRAAAITKTAEAVELADAVLQAIDDDAKASENQPPPGQQSCGGGGTTAGLSGNGAADNGNGTEAVQNESNGAVTSDQATAAAKILEAAKCDLDEDLGAVLRGKLEDKAREAAAAGTGAGCGEAEAPPPLLGNGSELVKRTRAATNALRVRLASLVEASRDDDEWNTTSGTELDQSRIIDAAHGDPCAFIEADEAEAVNTAVVVLFDRSSSMSGVIDLAREAVLSVALALEEINDLAVATAAFPSHYREDRVLPLTRFGEKARRTAARYEAVKASGGTPMTEAIWWGIDELMSRQEPRKILLVVTDGGPYNPLTTKQAIGIAGRMGVEVLGLGIGTDYGKVLFPIWAEISAIEELAPSMFGMLQRTLVGRAVA